MDPSFWNGKRVFLTGHTGFKGSWLCLLLERMGAQVHGYALPPQTTPSLFAEARVEQGLASSVLADVQDLAQLSLALLVAQPEVVFHLAAQAIVRDGYSAPVETFATNVMGTVNLLEAVRHCPSVRAVVIVTSDKCYENREWYWSYREKSALGGRDPYSASKACAELVTSAYRRSFFAESPAESRVAVASVRAGNVLGGGDWSRDRLVPDTVASLIAGKAVHDDGTRRQAADLFRACHGGRHTRHQSGHRQVTRCGRGLPSLLDRVDRQHGAGDAQHDRQRAEREAQPAVNRLPAHACAATEAGRWPTGCTACPPAACRCWRW